MSKYNLEKYQTEGRVVDYVLPIDGPVTLHILHAGRSNKPYLAAVSNSNTTKAKGGRRAGAAKTPQEIADALNVDRDMFAKYVITGWTGVKAKGKAVAFNKKECREFLGELPDWIIQELGQFATEPTNFIADDEPTKGEAVEQAKE
jgi:hypothetical protein